MWLKLNLFAFLCGVMPIVGMDQDQLDRVEKVLNVANDILQRSTSYPDLLEAAKTLPVSTIDKDHLCISALNEGLIIFSTEENLYDVNQRMNKILPDRKVRDTKELIKIGNRGLHGAMYVISSLMEQRRKDKKEYESDKKIMREAFQTESNIKAVEHQNKVDTLSQDLQVARKERENLQLQLTDLETKYVVLDDPHYFENLARNRQEGRQAPNDSEKVTISGPKKFLGVAFICV